ncbi:uncharacterized protein LOC131651118 [Vicia villosa]|uniref:uncharacterized protein LOC131651118 n=1 Tax=Vicia villosa TaxID=3911 RepID=UPI00273B0E38|nr:uncharacterized protein LOC131651118 [Vicia villosa]
MILIQETKLKEVTNLTVKSFWGSEDVGFSFLKAEGLSGGLLSIWKNQSVSVISSFAGIGYLGNKVSWNGGIFYIVNVYSACSISDKRVLWSQLLLLKQKFVDGEWIIGGDFNAVKKRSERFGHGEGRSNVEWREFNEFIEESGLVDVPCRGKKFSWFSGDGKSKSRIDRFLVSDSIVSSWGVVGQLIGSRDISDHCPVWLISEKEDWGPKPLKFNNEWFTDKNFILFVEKEWRGLDVQGRGDFVLKEKLRLLKDRLRWWNMNVFGKFDLEVEEGVRDLNALDDLELLNAGEIVKKKKASKRIWMNLKIKENMLIQKSRIKW